MNRQLISITAVLIALVTGTAWSVTGQGDCPMAEEVRALTTDDINTIVRDVLFKAQGHGRWVRINWSPGAGQQFRLPGV